MVEPPAVRGRSPEPQDLSQDTSQGVEESAEVVPGEEIQQQAQEWAAWLRRFPSSSVGAVEETQRWAGRMVRDLGLCPWAGPSIDKGAVRYICCDAVSREEYTAVITEAATTLLSSDLDPALAITFIVAPHFADRDFVDFHDFTIWLDEVRGPPRRRPSCMLLLSTLCLPP